MKIRTLVSLACMGSLVHLPLAAQDQPKNGRAEAAKHRSSDSDGDTPAPKKGQSKSGDEPPKRKAGDPDTDIAKPHEQHPAAVSTLMSDELAGFDEYPAELQVLMEKALALTRLNLTYTFGGSTPADGGMDCSGTIDYLLTQHGIKGVPRSSDEICEWVRERSGMHLAPDGVELSHDAFSALRPGDLLFWTGTYETLPRKLPVSHIMMYLGTLKKTSKPVVFGASDGRYYAGQRRSGVSVFDFSMPRNGSKAAFYGYGTIPGLSRIWSKEDIRQGLPSPGSAAREPVVATKPVNKADADETPGPTVKKHKPATTDDPPSPSKRHPSNGDPDKVAKAGSEAAKSQAKPSVADDNPHAAKNRKPAGSEEDPPSPRKKLKPGDEPATIAKNDSGAAKTKPKSSGAEEDPPAAHKKVKAAEESETVAQTDGDASKKAAPHKPVTHRKSAVKKKPASDDTDPGAVVHKAVDSIRKVFN